MAPLLTDDIRHIVETMDYSTWPEAVAAFRDAAAILLGFAGAFRRSELAELTVGDIAFDRADGLHIRVHRSKTDQEGKGLVKAIPYGRSPITCGPCAFQRWLSLLNAAETGTRANVMASVDANDPSWHVCRGRSPGYPVDDRPLFRPVTKSGSVGDTPLSDHSINQLVKSRAAAIGFDPTLFGGHSLRSGFVTEAFRRGQDSRTIRKQTGHRSDSMLDIYDRDNAPMHNNAAQNLGL
nr:site-specific integrase [Spelaeicoccus albus]